MHALLITQDGRGGRFYQHQGATVVALDANELSSLQKIAQEERGQLVELKEWPFETIRLRYCDEDWYAWSYRQAHRLAA